MGMCQVPPDRGTEPRQRPSGHCLESRGLQGWVVVCPGGEVGRKEGREALGGGEVVPAAPVGQGLGFE